MKKTVLAVMSIALVATACHHTDKVELTSGVCFENMDTTTDPTQDFYRYACGGWMDNHPLDAEHARYGSFDLLAENNQKQLRTIIDSVSAAKNQPGSVADKIATLYNMGMDSATLQKQGAEPIAALMKEIAELKDRAAIQNELAVLHLQGIDPFFGIFNEADPANSKMQIAWMYQGGIGMGERDYYLKKENADLREAYLQLMETEFALAGYDKLSGKNAKELAKTVMALETRLATAQYDNMKNRDPHATNHPMTIAEAMKVAPGIQLDKYFKAMGLDKIEKFNMSQPEYIAEVSKIMNGENIDNLKAYYAWNIINTAASYLSDDFVDANFAFYGKALSGKEQNRPRWKRVTSTIDGALSEALGQLYVEKYFPKEAKDRMITLVDNLKEAFAQRIQGAAWMDEATKAKALEKLSAILVKVGYPDKWRDYSSLEIKKDSYFANILRSNVFDVQYMISKIDKPTDRAEWLMPPQMVNAYYNPTTNEICFPAGILQPPFFDMRADDAVNYGAIGVVIGHEMTHGFDDQGRLYDLDGNLQDWWQPSDAENFTKNAQVLVEHFNGIKVLDNPETYANGKLSLGENIADNGGLNISFLAMQNAIAKLQVNAESMDGFTPAQRFFLAYAGVWASNIRDQEALRLTTSDVHSLCKWRVNGTLPHISAFHEAWNTKEGDAMYLAPEKRVTLW